MKYVEQTKSAILFILVLLSMFLTVSIWTYKPVYPTFETNSDDVEEIMIGEKKELQDILKPYRLLANDDDKLLGTTSTKSMDDMIELMQKWQINDFMLIDNDINMEEVNEYIEKNKRFLFMFNTAIPLNQFSNILKFGEAELPQAAFNRIVVDWANIETRKSVDIYFLNTENKTAYRAHAHVDDVNAYTKSMGDTLKNFMTYEEVERDNALSLYVPTGEIESIEYEYYINEVSVEVFKNMFFPDTPVIDRNAESDNVDRYIDGLALMTLDKYSKVVNYTYPAAENVADISPGKLLRNSFEYINEHGGFTADYRFSSMNVDKHITEYQLYVQGLPVFSGNIGTRIATTWGDDRIFSYRRPYYSLDIGGQTIKKLPTANEIVTYIKNNPEESLEEVQELQIGYYLTQEQERNLFKLEPSWFVVKGNSWQRILNEDVGGRANGLE